MAELVETYWCLVPDYAQVVGAGGALLTVTPAVREHFPRDQWDRVMMVQPDHGDALVTLMLAFPGSTILSTEETAS
jgi:hypothetical protein